MSLSEMFSNKKVIVFGTGKFQQNFEVIINNLDIIFYVDNNDNKKGTIYNGKMVKGPESILEYDLFDIVVIVASSYYDEIAKQLAGMGLQEDKNFINAIKILNYRSPFSILYERKVVIFGTGSVQKAFESIFNDLDVIYYVDNDQAKNGMVYNGKCIKNPETILEDVLDNILVIIASSFYLEISMQLDNWGLCEKVNYVNALDFFKLQSETFDYLKLPPSKLFYQIITDTQKVKYFCNRPFENMNIDHNGDAFLCCSGWLNISIGNLIDNKLMDVWNSMYARILRLSVLNGTYTFCNTDYCPLKAYKSKEHLSVCSKNIIKNKIVNLTNGPKSLELLYDYSCNLSCITCRKGFMKLDDQKVAKLELMQNRILQEGLKNVQMITIGNGEFFVSRLYKLFLKEINFEQNPNIEIIILTNALLFNPKNWGEVESIHGKNVHVTVSIDAATEKTYRTIRKGGEFNTLLKNLKFISELRKKGDIARLQFNFVVQQRNYKEMKQFIDLAQRFEIDMVAFNKLQNWGTFTNNEFEDLAIHNKTHPEHQQFISMLQDPIFKLPMILSSNLINKDGTKLVEVI
ncbi:MAG: radical SAM protein [Clostridia bacterium]|nr:radical SAM protein [Clostridia bacterium]